MRGPGEFTIGNFVNRISPRYFRRDRADFPRDERANSLVSVDPEGAADRARYGLLGAAHASNLAQSSHADSVSDQRSDS
jgi:hypothetical protein